MNQSGNQTNLTEKLPSSHRYSAISTSTSLQPAVTPQNAQCTCLYTQGNCKAAGGGTIATTLPYVRTPPQLPKHDQVHELYPSTLRGHEAIFRCTVNSVSKFFLNSCTCAHSVRSRKPLCGPSRSKEKCAQCMTEPWKLWETLRECSGVHGGARLCRFPILTPADMTGFTVKTEIYYLNP